MTEFPFAYLYNLEPRNLPHTEFWAGLFEGEGCFTVNYHHSSNRVYFTASLNMIDKDVMEGFFQWADVGYLSSAKQYLNQENRQPHYAWNAGEKPSLQIACDFWPYLFSRRQDQIVHCMNEILEFRAFHDLPDIVKTRIRRR